MSNFVPAVSPLSSAGIEEIASEVLTEFSPELLYEPGRFPIVEFFDHHLRERYGLDTGVDELGDGIEGLAFPDGRVLVSEQTYLGATQGNGRCRFTLAHEAFHGIQHRTQIQSRLVETKKLVLHRTQNVPAYRNPEWQANTFASCLLLPRQAVITQVNRLDWLVDVPRAVAATFGVSKAAAEIRLKKLNLIC